MAKLFYFLGHEQFQPEILVKHARLAEQAGFDGVMISEHFNPWVADVGAAGFAFATIGAIAQATKKIQLITGVTTPLFRYHPAVVAQAAATLDRLSGGRFILGVGNGEALNETPLGYSFPKYKERSDRMREALMIIQELLRGEKLTFNGTYYQTKDARLYSPPLHNMQIMLAAGGPKSGLLAAEYADGLIVSVKNPKETANTIVKPALARAHENGKNLFALTATRWTINAQTDDEAWHSLQAWRGLRAPSRNTATDPEQLQKEADNLPREEILNKYARVKSENDYIEAYAPLITTLHADAVAIQTTGSDQEKVIDLLGQKVLPHLRTL